MVLLFLFPFSFYYPSRKGLTIYDVLLLGGTLGTFIFIPYNSWCRPLDFLTIHGTFIFIPYNSLVRVLYPLAYV